MGKTSTNRSRGRATATERLLDWYDVHRRTLPWRAPPGSISDPYRVWLSEIMLQQTTVAAVEPYYAKFLARWPTVSSLAVASQDDVLAAWSGLGYYARARNLHRAARIVRDEFGGEFPCNAKDLRSLPGVGAYTAGAIAAIAFGASEAAVDANAERVLARYFAVVDPLPRAKKALHAHAQNLVPKMRAGDFAQALMDLGALICAPKAPSCMTCPWSSDCRAYAMGLEEQLPRKAQKKPRPLRCGAAFVALDPCGAILLEKRPENGLLGGMMQPPMTTWGKALPKPAEALKQAPFAASWKKRLGTVRHVFTHFELELEVYRADLKKQRDQAGRQWIDADSLHSVAMPTVMRKVLQLAGISSGG